MPRDATAQLRGQLGSLLAEDAANTERLLDRLGRIAKQSPERMHAALLEALTRLTFSEDEARAHWEAILGHRHDLSLSLGRDVGVRMAALDYFMNVNKQLTQPTLIDLELTRPTPPDEHADPLTGLLDEHGFRRTLQHELRRAKRYGNDVSIVLLDLDDFLELNRRHDRALGDRILRETAILLKNKIRDIDFAARPGEDELALLLPETPRNGAMLVAERFRREVELHYARRDLDGAPVSLTVSGGVAAYPADAAATEQLLSCAAQALYRAKAAGKNAVQLYFPERRRYLRFDLEPGRFEVEVLQPAGGGGRPHNFSRNGIAFDSHEPIAVGEAVELRVVERETGEPTPLRMRGRVVRLEELPDGERAGGYEIGICFELGSTGREDQRLLDFLEQALGGAV